MFLQADIFALLFKEEGGKKQGENELQSKAERGEDKSTALCFLAVGGYKVTEADRTETLTAPSRPAGGSCQELHPKTNSSCSHADLVFLLPRVFSKEALKRKNLPGFNLHDSGLLAMSTNCRLEYSSARKWPQATRQSTLISLLSFIRSFFRSLFLCLLPPSFLKLMSLTPQL